MSSEIPKDECSLLHLSELTLTNPLPSDITLVSISSALCASIFNIATLDYANRVPQSWRKTLAQSFAAYTKTMLPPSEI